MKKAADGYTSYGSKASTPSPVTDYAGKASKPDSYTQYKKGGIVKKAKDGSAFAKLAPPYDKATYADKIAGATKGKAKSGTKMKKAQMGSDMMMQSPMMKKGGAMKKCKYGCK